MNTEAQARPEPSLEAAPVAPATMSAARSLYWSVRRELWENRSVYVVPLVVAVLVLFGFAISTIGMPARRRAVLLLDPAQQRARIGVPYDVAAMMIILTAFLVAVFYCLDALYGERRDRSILFWKSLPVSDLTTVLSKASVPLVVLPLLVFAIVVTTQFLMLLLSSAVLLRSGLAATTWTRFNLLQQSLILLYGLIVHALWHAPIYSWLLLVSAWARRTPVLWATLPPLALCAIEKMALDTSYFASLLGYRFGGAMREAFAVDLTKKSVVIDRLAQLDPLRFLSSPGLWTGLLAAAAILVAAARVRRNREPI